MDNLVIQSVFKGTVFVLCFVLVAKLLADLVQALLKYTNHDILYIATVMVILVSTASLGFYLDAKSKSSDP